MRKMIVFVGLALFLILAGAQAALAQDEDKPSLVVLSFQPRGTIEWIELGLLKSLISYGLISAEDIAEGFGGPMENSPISYQRLNAAGQLDFVQEMIADALDSEPDALVTIGSRVTLAALIATYDMEDPPAIIFADVYNPYDAGIADAPCIKPNHVTGIESAVNYADIVPLLLLQDPELTTIGTIHSSDDAGGAYGAARFAEEGEALGLTVEQTAVTSLADLALATEGLVSKGVQAILLPVDTLTTAGLPLIDAIAQDNDIPLFAATINDMFFGALVGGGFGEFLDTGELAAALAAGHLRGDLDLATTGIGAIDSSTVIGLNLNKAEALGISFSEELENRSDFSLQLADDGYAVWVDTETSEISQWIMEQFQRRSAPPEPLEARLESDRAFLAGLECTAERIAEQQAVLDAMEG